MSYFSAKVAIFPETCVYVAELFITFVGKRFSWKYDLSTWTMLPE